jgi:hypothetical protein
LSSIFSGPFQHLANGEILKYCKTRDDNGGRKWQDLAIQNINGFSCAAFCQLDQVLNSIFIRIRIFIG